MTVDRARFQEINRMYAKAGVRVMMPDNWPYISAMAGQMDNISVARDPDAQALAQETITSYRMGVGIAYSKVGVLPNASGHTEVAEHDGPQYDPKLPASMNRLYGILAGLPDQLIPLSDSYTWKDVVAQRLKHYRLCNLRISRGCEPDKAYERFALQSGEFVPIYASCGQCQGWFALDNFDRRRTQARPLLGYDFQNGAFRR